MVGWLSMLHLFQVDRKKRTHLSTQHSWGVAEEWSGPVARGMVKCMALGGGEAV